MCLIFVVHNVLQIYACSIFQVLKKLLIKDERHSTDLLHPSFFLCVSVSEVDSDTDGKFTTEFFSFEAFQCCSPTICTHDNVKIKFIEGMGRRVKRPSPSMSYKQIETIKAILNKYHIKYIQKPVNYYHVQVVNNLLKK